SEPPSRPRSPAPVPPPCAPSPCTPWSTRWPPPATCWTPTPPPTPPSPTSLADARQAAIMPYPRSRKPRWTADPQVMSPGLSSAWTSRCRRPGESPLVHVATTAAAAQDRPRRRGHRQHLAQRRDLQRGVLPGGQGDRLAVVGELHRARPAAHRVPGLLRLDLHPQ